MTNGLLRFGNAEAHLLHCTWFKDITCKDKGLRVIGIYFDADPIYIHADIDVDSTMQR